MLTINEAHALIVALSNSTELSINGRHVIDVEKVVRMISPYVADVDIQYTAGDGKYSLKLDQRKPV